MPNDVTEETKTTDSSNESVQMDKVFDWIGAPGFEDDNAREAMFVFDQDDRDLVLSDF